MANLEKNSLVELRCTFYIGSVLLVFFIDI